MRSWRSDLDALELYFVLVAVLAVRAFAASLGAGKQSLWNAQRSRGFRDPPGRTVASVKKPHHNTASLGSCPAIMVYVHMVCMLPGRQFLPLAVSSFAFIKNKEKIRHFQACLPARSADTLLSNSFQELLAGSWGPRICAAQVAQPSTGSVCIVLRRICGRHPLAASERRAQLLWSQGHSSSRKVSCEACGACWSRKRGAGDPFLAAHSTHFAVLRWGGLTRGNDQYCKS